MGVEIWQGFSSENGLPEIAAIVRTSHALHCLSSTLPEIIGLVDRAENHIGARSLSVARTSLTNFQWDEVDPFSRSVQTETLDSGNTQNVYKKEKMKNIELLIFVQYTQILTFAI